MTKQQQKIYGWRVFFSFAYLVFAVGLVYFRYNEMFYLELQANSFQLDRFWWCLAASFFGFSMLVFRLWHHPESVFPTYITYYPALLFVQSALVFSVAHLFPTTSGFVFYYLSFAACFILAFLVDSFWTLVFSLVPKSDK